MLFPSALEAVSLVNCLKSQVDSNRTKHQDYDGEWRGLVAPKIISVRMEDITEMCKKNSE